MAEFDEVQQALAEGVDPLSGYRYVDSLEATYDVDGVLLPRPFRSSALAQCALRERCRSIDRVLSTGAWLHID